MLGAEIDFIVVDYDMTSNIAIASRKDAMELRSEIELPKLKLNDVVRVRILAVGIKHIIVDLYGKEIVIKADNLQHTYIVNCKDYYSPGEYLKVRIKKIDIEKMNLNYLQKILLKIHLRISENILLKVENIQEK